MKFNAMEPKSQPVGSDGEKDFKLVGNESGLVGYWTFIEGNGATANDQTGPAYDGALLNGAIWMPSDAPLVH